MDVVRWIVVAIGALGMAAAFVWLGIIVRIALRSGWQWPAGIALVSRAVEGICVSGVFVAIGSGYLLNKWVVVLVILFAVVVRNAAFVYLRRHPGDDPLG